MPENPPTLSERLHGSTSYYQWRWQDQIIARYISFAIFYTSYVAKWFACQRIVLSYSGLCMKVQPCSTRLCERAMHEHCLTVMDITDAVQIAHSIFIEQILPSCSDYFHWVVGVKQSTWLPATQHKHKHESDGRATIASYIKHICSPDQPPPHLQSFLFAKFLRCHDGHTFVFCQEGEKRSSRIGHA